jgi:FKBP-type peptidyl-prolyl cis-trans isomerase SlyD
LHYYKAFFQNEVFPIYYLHAGEEKSVVVPAAEAYGERNEEVVQTLPREQFEGIELQKGMTLYGQSPDGQTIAVTVTDFNDKEVTIDYNHPLAGSYQRCNGIL